MGYDPEGTWGWKNFLKGLAIFGVSDLVEVITDNFNPIRDVLMRGNQKAYNITHTIFDTLGSLAVLVGTFGPKILQNIAKSGGVPKISNGKTVGYQRNFYDKNGQWNFRIDAITHGNPKYITPLIFITMKEMLNKVAFQKLLNISGK